MPDFALPRHDRLGPDPEPLGARFDHLIEGVDQRSPQPQHTLVIAGGLRGRIIVARLGDTPVRQLTGARS